MINLLPKKDKDFIKNLERKRKRIFFEFMVTSSLLVFLLSLLAIDFNIKGEVKSQRIILTGEKNAQALLNEKNMKESFSLINNLSRIMKEQFYMTDFLRDVSSKIPEGIYLTELNGEESYSRKKGLERSFYIKGTADNRITLFDFKESLEKEFSNLDFPPSNWIESENIEFYLNIKINNEKNKSPKK